MFMLYALPIVLLPYSLHLPADVGVGAAFVLLLCASILGRSDPPGFPRGSHLLPPLVGLLMAVLVGYAIAMWHDASNAFEALLGAKFAITYPLLYLAYRHCGLDLQATRRLIVLVLLVAVAAGLEAVFQGLQFDPGRFAEDQRAAGPFGGVNAANRAGVFFAMFLPVPVALALQPGCRKPVRWLALAGALVLVAAILPTFSRQSYLIAAFGIALLLLNRGVPVAALALLVIAVAGAVMIPESAIQRIEETRQVGASGTTSFDGSTTSRLDIWKGGISMLSDHPAGVGLGRFNDNIGHYTNRPGVDAHNGFLLMLAECGPFGLAMMLWLFWRLMDLARKLRRSARDSLPEARALALGMTVAVLSMAAGNVYGSSFFSGLVMHSMWILCGLMERYGVALAYATDTQAAADPPHGPPANLATRFPLAARAWPGLAGPQRYRPPR